MMIIFYLHTQSIWEHHYGFGNVQHLMLLDLYQKIIQIYLLSGRCNIRNFKSLAVISSKPSWCVLVQEKGHSFLVRLLIGFISLCKFGQNILKQLTIPAKELHCLLVLVILISEQHVVYFDGFIKTLFLMKIVLSIIQYSPK